MVHPVSQKRGSRKAQALGELIVQIYATAGELSAWAPLLDRMCAHLGITTASAQLLTEEDHRLRQVWHTRDTGSMDFAARHDRWVNNPDNPRLHVRPAGAPRAIGSDCRLFADAPDLMRRLNEGLARAGLGQAFWVGFPIAEGQHFSLMFHRRVGDIRDLSDDEETLLNELLPHFRQSAKLNQRIAGSVAQVAQFASLIDDTGLAMIVCDRRGRVEWHNSAANALLHSAATLRIVNDMLQCRSADDQRRLCAALSAVADGRLEGSVAAIGMAGDAALHLRIGAVGAGPAGGARHALALTITRPDAAITLDPDDIARLFGLTPAESRLAAALVGGDTVARFAAARGIAVGTARIQLKQVFAKTDTQRQADLVQRLLGSSARRH